MWPENQIQQDIIRLINVSFASKQREPRRRSFIQGAISELLHESHNQRANGRALGDGKGTWEI